MQNEVLRLSVTLLCALYLERRRIHIFRLVGKVDSRQNKRTAQ